MRERKYYSERNGFVKIDKAMNFDMLKKAFRMLYLQLEEEGYFQPSLGKDCVDGFIKGSLGNDLETAVYVKTGKENIWPVLRCIEQYSEDDLYTIIEFLFDCCAKPVSVFHHDFCGCGIHVTKSDGEKGRIEFRSRINPLLKRFKNIELDISGEILQSVESGFELLLTAEIPSKDQDNVVMKVEAAKLKFRRARASLDERRDALRDLADVLEYLRPQIKEVLMRDDEKELFKIANTFGIRHHNQSQKNEYDKVIWHSWMFYCYLATIHTCIRLIENQKAIVGKN